MQRKSSVSEDVLALVGTGLVVAILVSLALVAAFGADWYRAMLVNGAPAWIQAIGSIVAILVSTRIAGSQIEASRKLEAYRVLEEEKKRILIVDALLRSLESEVLTAEKQFKDFPGMPIRDFYVERIKASSNVVKNIDLVSCPPSIIAPVLRLYPEPCGTLLVALAQFRESFDHHEDTYARYASGLHNSFAVAKMMVSLTRKDCENAIKEISASPKSFHF